VTTGDLGTERAWGAGSLRREAAVGALVAAFVGLAGTAVGLVWSGVAPGVAVGPLAAGFSGAYRYQIGADAWFLLLGGLAGVLCGLAVTLVFGERGPGAAVGLAVGGTLAAIVGDRVGYLAVRGTTTAALRAIGAHPDPGTISQIDFRIRALGVLGAWPIAALVVLLVVVAIEAVRS
jgi:hypothetical protein